MLPWKMVAAVGTVLALTASTLMFFCVSEKPEGEQSIRSWLAASKEETASSTTTVQDLLEAVKNVLGSPLFWQVGFAHAAAFLARTSDRVLGSFYQDITELPKELCGGLTACVTVGFIYGVSKSNFFHQLPDVFAKSRLLRRNYLGSVLSALGLAACANSQWLFDSVLVSVPPDMHHGVLAVAVAALSASMAASVAFQFYQMPQLAAKTFGKSKAVCLSFLDGMGFFLAAPIWAATSTLVHDSGVSGWSTAWTIVAALFAIGGMLMVNVFPGMHEENKEI
jgi:hypothetical protein